MRLLCDTFPEVTQVNHLGLHNANDLTIWQYAKTHDYTIVTFDADFVDIANLYGLPPKIIWLRMSNMTTKAIAEVLIAHKADIEEFLTSPLYQEMICFEITDN